MAKETEIKLQCVAATLDAIAASKLLAEYGAGQWQQRLLRNRYFDTPDMELAAARVALRIRHDGVGLVQTLKTRGSTLAGLSERNEWEWPVAGEELELSKLDAGCWPDSLQQLDKQKLAAVFTTDFTRRQVELNWQEQGETVRVELALDTGAVCTDSQSREVCELELELLQGSPAALLRLAVRLAAEHAVWPSDISKAERGYDLLAAPAQRVPVTAPGLAAESSMDEVIGQLIGYLLASMQQQAQAFLQDGHWKQLRGWVEDLVQLRALLSSTGQIVPRKSSHQLRSRLDALLQDWLPVYQAGAEQTLREQAVARFAEEMQQPRWGQLVLQLALWLQEAVWQQGRNQRASRQAQAPLARWLSRFLHEELGSLPKLDYLSHRHLLLEQQPRMERVVFWLQHARHVLEVERVDEVFGSVRKLLQAIYFQDEQALRSQAAMLWQNAGFRQLLNG